MTINIQYVKMPTSETMTGYIETKLNKLAVKYDMIINANVYLKQEKDVAGKGDICEIDLSLPGPKLFASSKEENFESAVKETISDLSKQLKKRKASLKHH